MKTMTNSWIAGLVVLGLTGCSIELGSSSTDVCTSDTHCGQTDNTDNSNNSDNSVTN